MADNIMHLEREGEDEQSYAPHKLDMPPNYGYPITGITGQEGPSHYIHHESFGDWTRVSIRVYPWAIKDPKNYPNAVEVGIMVPGTSRFIAEPIIRHNLVGFTLTHKIASGRLSIARADLAESQKPTAGGIIIIEGLYR